MEDPLMCEIDWGPVWAHLGLSLLSPLDRWMHWMRSLCAAPRFAGKGAAAASDQESNPVSPVAELRQREKFRSDEPSLVQCQFMIYPHRAVRSILDDKP